MTKQRNIYSFDEAKRANDARRSSAAASDGQRRSARPSDVQLAGAPMRSSQRGSLLSGAFAPTPSRSAAGASKEVRETRENYDAHEVSETREGHAPRTNRLVREGQRRREARQSREDRLARSVRTESPRQIRGTRQDEAGRVPEAIRERASRDRVAGGNRFARAGRNGERQAFEFAETDGADGAREAVQGEKPAKDPNRRTVYTALLGLRDKSAGVLAKASGVRQRFLKSKAGRDFDRQFAGSDAESAPAGPRAAVYKAEMGSSHKQATRLQVTREQEQHSRSTWGQKLADLSRRRTFVAGSAIAACLLLSCIFLYQPAQQYYQSVREHDRAAAEYAALQDRNDKLSSSVAYLSTDEGMAQTAHEEYGMIKKGEQSAIVYGVHDSSDDTEVNAAVRKSDIEMPATWYSPVLDVVFGVA